jgi:DNA-binding CsgD family transcriptional regulator
VREAIGSSRLPHHELFRRALAAARSALDEAGFLAAWEAGQALTPDEARSEAEVVLSAASRPADTSPVPNAAGGHGLTPREVEVLRLLGQRQTDREIAAALFISPKTAGNHVTSILGKLGVENRREAAAVAARLGLGRSEPDPR